MKKIFFISIVTTISLFSCVDQESDDIDFTILNQTDKTVKILGFNTQLDPNTNGKADPINISPNSNFKVTRITGIDDNVSMRFYSINGGGVDSVRVIFNNEKVHIYTKTESPIEDFSIFRGDENHEHYITEEDYNTAEDCDGNCE